MNWCDYDKTIERNWCYDGTIEETDFMMKLHVKDELTKLCKMINRLIRLCKIWNELTKLCIVKGQIDW